MMSKKTLLGWLATALIAGMGIDCGGVDGGPHNDPFPQPAKTKDDRPTCPEVEFRSPEERCLTIQTFVESRLGPYDVYINITGGNGAYPPHVPIASGGWKHGLVYRTGVKMTVLITLRYEGAPSKDGFCSITDGTYVDKDELKSIRAQGGSPYEAVCTLTTSQ